MDVDKGFLDTGTAHGKAASQEVVGHLRGWMIPSTEDLRFLLDRLGIPKAVDRMPPLRSVAAQ
jgi:hypothetical protein